MYCCSRRLRLKEIIIKVEEFPLWYRGLKIRRRSQLPLRFDPWPGNFHMQPKTNTKKDREPLELMQQNRAVKCALEFRVFTTWHCTCSENYISRHH